MYLERLDEGVDRLHGPFSVPGDVVCHRVGRPVLLQVSLDPQELSSRFDESLINPDDNQSKKNKETGVAEREKTTNRHPTAPHATRGEKSRLASYGTAPGLQ